MKKIWILALMCILVMGLAYAEGGETAAQEPLIDLSVYTDSELVLLLEQVNGEIAARRIEKTATIPAGSYIGGKDIPTGRYILAGAAEEGAGGIVMLYNDSDESQERELYEFVYTEECSFYISVDENEVLTIPFACTLTIYAGIVFE